MAELEEFRAQAEVEEQNEVLFRKVVDVQNKGNTEFFNELFAVKDRVIARINSAGTFTRDYHGIEVTGNKVESSIIIIARIENGKIVEERKEVDVLNVMHQLGMELKPKEREQ
jgi:predicted ester cyclase